MARISEVKNGSKKESEERKKSNVAAKKETEFVPRLADR